MLETGGKREGVKEWRERERGLKVEERRDEDNLESQRAIMSGGDESSARRKKTNAVRLKRTSEHRGSVLDHRTKRLEEPEVKRRTFRPGGRKRW